MTIEIQGVNTMCASMVICIKCLKADFLSWQKSLTYLLQIFVDKFTGSSRCSKWPNDRMVAVTETLLAPCTRKKRLQRKMTKDYCWIGVQENIGMFSKL